MTKRRRTTDQKEETLRKHGTLNPRPERVTDPLFQASTFFDARDLVQVKYEMLRQARDDGATATKAAATFGFSRPTFYEAQSAFEREGLVGLVPKKRGPRGAHKLMNDVVDFIEARVEQEGSTSSATLADLIQEQFGVTVHPRSIERALARRKKKRRARPHRSES